MSPLFGTLGIATVQPTICAMDLQQLLRMNSGEGKLSYATNSMWQWLLMTRTKPYIEEALPMVISMSKPTKLSIADLGCSSGPSALLAVDMVLDVINRSCRQAGIHELHAFLNDLPTNDFNAVFKTIPSFFQMVGVGKDGTSVPCFVSATPGSFYGRLFPCQSLHFVYSANSLHWLSQAPDGLTGERGNLNKGNIGLGKTSPHVVFEAYLAQFRRDFTAFLKLRAEEIVPGGCMLISLKGRTTFDYSSDEGDNLCTTFAEAFHDLVQEGLVDEDKVDSFNMPFHEAHIEELREIIQEDGSFNIIRLEVIQYEGENVPCGYVNPDNLTNLKRAFTEPLLVHHFGEAVMDQLFDKLKEKIILFHPNKAVALVISLVRKV